MFFEKGISLAQLLIKPVWIILNCIRLRQLTSPLTEELDPFGAQQMSSQLLPKLKSLNLLQKIELSARARVMYFA